MRDTHRISVSREMREKKINKRTSAKRERGGKRGDGFPCKGKCITNRICSLERKIFRIITDKSRYNEIGKGKTTNFCN